MYNQLIIVSKNYIANYSGLSKFSWQGIVLSFLESTLVGIYYFLSIYFVDEMQMNISTAGFMISFYGIGTILGGLVGGKLSDKISPFTVTTCSLFFQAAAILLLSHLKFITSIAIDLFLLGAATYSFITANYVLVLSGCHQSSEEKLKAINVLAVSSNLGVGLSAIIVSSIAEHSFQSIFYISGTGLLMIAIYLTINKNQFNKPHTLTLVSKTFASQRIESPLPQPSSMLYFVLICVFFTGMIVSQLSTTYAVYLTSSFPSIGVHAFGLLFSFSTALIVLFQTFLVNRFSKYNKIHLIGFGSFLIGLGMLLLNFSPAFFPYAFIAALVYSVGEMIFFSMVQLFCYEQGGENKKGSSLGKYRMVYAASRFIGPTIGGVVYHYFGGAMLWNISGLIGLFFLALFFSLKNILYTNAAS